MAGVLPTEISQLYQLEGLYLRANTFIGLIPSEYFNISTLLEQLYLNGNDLSGGIPDSITNCARLISLVLTYNRFTGVVPHLQHSLSDLHSINVISLGQNQLSGQIPECFGNVTSLSALSLDSNILTSSIPSSLWLLKNLLKLDLSGNSLGGILPPEMDNLVALNSIDLAMNQFSGTIPTTIGKLQSLVYLCLAQNKLEGSIPVSVGSMIILSTLDLSYNNLSGVIPKSLESLRDLKYFDVSFNDLSGEIPTGGPFRNFRTECFKENNALCGLPRFHDDMFGGDLSLKSWVENLLPQSLDRVMDINLLTNLDDEHCDKMMHCVFSILVLALKCSAESPANMINMKEALSELQKIKRQFF